MFCVQCGCNLPTVAKFCARCGLPVIPSSAEASPGNQQTAEPALDTRRAVFPQEQQQFTQLHATPDGRLVVPPNAVLPNKCVKCGDIPTYWLRKTFSWFHPGLYLLLISPLIFVIVTLIVRKRIELSVPLCEAHKSLRAKMLWTGGILLAACLPVPIGLAIYLDSEDGGLLAFWLAVTLFVTGLLFLQFSKPIRPKFIGISSAEFVGACPAFLAEVQNSAAAAGAD